jgi:PmbA protein
MAGGSDFAERLHAAAAAACARLEASPAARWEVFAKASFRRGVEVARGRPLAVVEVEETGLAVRTRHLECSGFAAASGLEEDAARRAVEAALTTAAPCAIDPLPPARALGSTEVHGARPLPAKGWATHAGQELERAVASRAGGRLRLKRSVFEEGAFAWLLTTAEGWVARHEDSSSALLAEIEVVGDRAGVWRDWIHIPEPEVFDLEAAAEQITDRAALISHRVTTDDGLRDLILHPEVAAQVLAAAAPLFLAVPEEHDVLPQLLDRDGRLASAALTLVDDRSDRRAPVSGPCDGEGLPARRTLLLEQGIPRHRLASWRDAARYALPVRGGALRLSYRDYPATGLANLAVDVSAGIGAGALLGSADRALYLLRPLAAVELGPDPDTYRIVASGVWLDGREVRGWHPVVELRGSLGRLLRRIEAVGTDLRWFQTSRGFVGTPSLLVRRQRVVG